MIGGWMDGWMKGSKEGRGNNEEKVHGCVGEEPWRYYIER